MTDNNKNIESKKSKFGFLKKWWFWAILVFLMGANNISNNGRFTKQEEQIKELTKKLEAAEIEKATALTEIEKMKELFENLKKINAEENKPVEEDVVQEVEPHEEVKEETKKEKAEKAIQSVINKRKPDYKDLRIDRLTVNEDMGTDDNDDDYIVLVYSTWTKMNTVKTSNEILRVYSDDMAASIASEGITNVNEVAVFIDDDYNKRSVKYHYTFNGTGFIKDEVIE